MADLRHNGSRVQTNRQSTTKSGASSLESSILSIPDYPTAFWITAGLAIVLVGIAKAGFGGGVGMVATPLMALTISVTDAAAILLPLLIVADIFSIRQ